MNSSTSLSLLERARSRNEEAWKRLVYLYAPMVEHWCSAWGVQGADLDDLSQEVFQAVAQGLNTFRHEHPQDTFRGWLRVIARRKTLDFYRQKKRQPAAEGGSDALRRFMLLPEAEERSAVGPSAEIKQLHQRALELIRFHFEDRTWKAFYRCAVEGESPVDIARDMGITPAAVRKAKSRVLRCLKEELGDLLA
jgi:RNA polymerase sigma-70 factor (ECF subfamily)